MGLVKAMFAIHALESFSIPPPLHSYFTAEVEIKTLQEREERKARGGGGGHLQIDCKACGLNHAGSGLSCSKIHVNQLTTETILFIYY